MKMTLLQHPAGSGLLHTPSQELLPPKPRATGIKRKAACGEPRGRLPKGSKGRSLVLGDLQDRQAPPLQWFHFRQHSLDCQPPMQQPQHHKTSPQWPKDGQPWTQMQPLLHHPLDQQPPQRHSQGQQPPQQQPHSQQPPFVLAAPVWCNLCNLDCVTHHNLKIHTQGKKHIAKWEELSRKGEGKAKCDELSLQVHCPQSQQRPQTPTALVWCSLCKLNCMNPHNLRRHLQGRKHKAKWVKQSLAAGHEVKWDDLYVESYCSDDQQPPQDQMSPVWCTLCKVNCLNSGNLKRHLQGKKHKAKWNEQPLQVCSLPREQPPEIQAAPVWCKSLQVGTA